MQYIGSRTDNTACNQNGLEMLETGVESSEIGKNPIKRSWQVYRVDHWTHQVKRGEHQDSMRKAEQGENGCERRRRDM